MKSISRSLPLRAFAPSFLFPTNTFCPSSTLRITHNSRKLYTTMPPPPPPKRKWNRPRPSGAAPSKSAAQQSTIAQQPKRPKVSDSVPENEGPVDVKAMYSTSAGNAEAKRFSEMAGKLDPTLLQGLEKMGFEYMSPVQQKVLTELPSLTADCMVQAKTGTGKTVAFLLPAIQNLLSGNAPPRGKVGILIICPTRELALQIAKEAHGVTACLTRKMECHTAFGGTSRASNLKAFLRGDPTILVATPGRLDDILGEDEVRERFSHIKTIVLDEADQMLDAGFAPAVKKILRRLPQKNQSPGWSGMCFSATTNKEVMDVAKCVLYPGATTLSTVDPNELPTHARVPQFSIVVPSVSRSFAALLALIHQEHAQNPDDFKVIVFGTTANGVGLLYDLYKVALPQFKLFELHSRMSQPARTKTTQQFKDATTGILVASDVVGRGMDFPNVGLVIQVGLPSSTEQYVHRVGRTARAGKDGRAVIILSEQESFFTRINRTLPIQQYPVDIVSQMPQHYAAIERAFNNVDEEAKAKAYQAFLGYNKTFLKKLNMSPADLVRLANEYAKAMGCPEPPLIEKSTIGKMGLKGVPGLRIGSRR